MQPSVHNPNDVGAVALRSPSEIPDESACVLDAVRGLL